MAQSSQPILSTPQDATPELPVRRLTKWFIQRASFAWIVTIAGLILMYILLNTSSLFWIDPNIRYYLVIPLLWILVAASAWWGWKYGLTEKPPFTAILFQLSFIAGLAQIAALLIAGLIFGFGDSPYTQKFPQVLGNLLYLATYIGGMEMARGFLLAHAPKRMTLLAFILVTLGFTALTLPISVYLAIQDVQSAFVISGKLLLPRLAENLLATYLAWIGGPLASFIYRIIMGLFEWLMPVLPKMTWMVQAFIGTIIPAIILVLINQSIAVHEEEPVKTAESSEKKEKRQVAFSWIVVAIITVLLIWFNMGLFGVRPYLVSGISMNPTLYAGDVAVIQDLSAREVQIGDIILYYTESGNRVLHRVIEIRDNSGKVQFITQGDNIYLPDDPVEETQYGGKMVIAIPKIGWVSIGVRRLMGWDTFEK
jgi:signal peptidase